MTLPWIILITWYLPFPCWYSLKLLIPFPLIISDFFTRVLKNINYHKLLRETILYIYQHLFAKNILFRLLSSLPFSIDKRRYLNSWKMLYAERVMTSKDVYQLFLLFSLILRQSILFIDYHNIWKLFYGTWKKICSFILICTFSTDNVTLGKHLKKIILLRTHFIYAPFFFAKNHVNKMPSANGGLQVVVGLVVCTSFYINAMRKELLGFWLCFKKEK